jgi:hypothetical protein
MLNKNTKNMETKKIGVGSKLTKNAANITLSNETKTLLAARAMFEESQHAIDNVLSELSDKNYSGFNLVGVKEYKHNVVALNISIRELTDQISDFVRSNSEYKKI